MKHFTIYNEKNRRLKRYHYRTDLIDKSLYTDRYTWHWWKVMDARYRRKRYPPLIDVIFAA